MSDRDFPLTNSPGCDVPLNGDDINENSSSSSSSVAVAVAVALIDPPARVERRGPPVAAPAPQRLSSPDRLRARTYKLHMELQALANRHNRRHERLRSIRAPPSIVQERSASSVGAARQVPQPKPTAASQLQLPNLRRCFEEARTRYLMETQRKKKTMPPLYASHIPRDDEAARRKQQRDIMKDPDSFGLRFFSPSSLPGATKDSRHM
ncbi:uncharacterized protein TM35_000302500 [Trypanosoma theileri]|uniref:Uncharacterized protein n=1 Tax=Trypanosoma theileri TaxID=67003 RepID=A0A1X0NPZ7_9TRYP|nr:uncharacterized protein TM35_000302500 [Trypanosoma theileri]ORC86210.1 hypothetical protein TM35_000302500 [Trypanosoma theileri]